MMTTWQEQLRANLERAANVERSPNLIRATDKEDALLVHAVLTLDVVPARAGLSRDGVIYLAEGFASSPHARG